MGCDIHIVAQRRGAAGQWQRVRGGFSEGDNPFDWRGYALFGWLAGVRNYSGVVPLSLPRDLPEDFEDVDSDDYYGRTYNTPEYLDVGEHSRSWFSVEELAAVDYSQLVEDRRVGRQIGPNLFSGAETCEPGEGKKMPLREFLGEEFMSDLVKLQELGAERVVFGFDN